MFNSIVLASTSPYRGELLSRLLLDFEQINPEVDERPHEDESPAALALRLAEAKALSGLRARPGSLVIGSDQVYELDGQAWGKPGDRHHAMQQLRLSSGKEGLFHTAVCLASDRNTLSERVTTRVRFRSLSDQQIGRYLDREPAFDCAGSFRSEQFGITLFEWIRSDDPYALVGLPLMAVTRLLARFDIALP